MKFFLTPKGDLQFQNLDPSLVKILSESLRTKNWKANFLTSTCSSALQQKSPEFFSDWEKYIEPEVSSLLEQSHAIVLADLGNIKKETHDSTEEVTLTIPPTHQDAWLRMLSVARFAVASALQEKKSAELLFQQEFLTVVQQCVVEAEEKR